MPMALLFGKGSCDLFGGGGSSEGEAPWLTSQWKALALLCWQPDRATWFIISR